MTLPARLTFRDLKSVLHNLSDRDAKFALDVMTTIQNSGFRSATPGQSRVLRDLYARATSTSSLVQLGPMQRILDLFAAATESGLKNPRLIIRDGDGIKYKLMPSTREPGSIAVFEDKAERGFRGTIKADGTYDSRAGSVALVRALGAFACDPVKAAQLFGHQTGCCCFCARELTDPQSVAVGYGPICASKWGLPHGDLDLAPKAPIEGDELARLFKAPALPKVQPGVGPKPWEKGFRGR
jgi:Family of unknown function (DUF6011)